MPFREGAQTFPTTFFIGRDGFLAKRLNHAVEYAELGGIARQLLAVKPEPKAEGECKAAP